MSKINLKDDFYNHINQEWIENTQIPDDKPSIGAFNEISDKVEKELRDLVSSWANKSVKTPKDPIIKNFVKYYKQASDFKKRNSQKTKPALQYIQKIENINSLKDLNESFAQLELEGYSLPIGFSVSQDFKDSQKQILFFEIASLILPEKGYYKDVEQKKELLSQYKEIAIELVRRFKKTKKEATKLVNNTIKFDKLLIPLNMTSEYMADYVRLYNITDIDVVSNACSGLDIKSILQKLVNKEVTEINVYYPKSLKYLNKLINDETFELLKSWMLVNEMFSLSQYLDYDTRVIGSKFGRVLTGIPMPKSDEKHAYSLAYSMFDMPIGKYYGEHFFGPKAKKDVEEMVFEMINVYKDRLSKNEWLSKETIKKAINKLNHLKMNVGYPDILEPYYSMFETVEYKNGGSLVSNYLNFSKIVSQYNYSQYMQKTNDKYWDMSPSEVNAYFHPSFNKIVFPAGILQKPFYSLEQSKSANYGGIGETIAHEISHAFDNNGASFDELGNLKNWWKKQDYKKFEELEQKVIDQFEGQETPFGKCNGKLTVSENIADLSGVQCALAAAKLSSDFNAEEFFTNFAVVERSKERKEYAKMLLQTDVHSPGLLRVNIQIKNIDEFYSTYDIKETDKMFLPKEKRIVIW